MMAGTPALGTQPSDFYCLLICANRAIIADFEPLCRLGTMSCRPGTRLLGFQMGARKQLLLPSFRPWAKECVNFLYWSITWQIAIKHKAIKHLQGNHRPPEIGGFQGLKSPVWPFVRTRGGWRRIQPIPRLRLYRPSYVFTPWRPHNTGLIISASNCNFSVNLIALENTQENRFGLIRLVIRGCSKISNRWF